jgi:predicted ATPase
MSSEPFVKRVTIRNYKSIGQCDVELGRLSILVGRNGSGKSNFLDALRFVLEGLQTSLDHAVKARGGIDGVRRRSTGHPHNFYISLEINLPSGSTADYGFEVGAKPRGGFVVKHERLKVVKPSGEIAASFHVSEGELQSSTADDMPPAIAERLYLVTASGRREFLEPYNSLMAMGFYNLNPEQMKDVQSPDAGELLRRDGSNIASVVARLEADKPELKERIRDYLVAIVPDVVDFRRTAIGHKETLEFRQEVKGSQHPWRFNAISMSDGTLRSLGIVVAAMQLVNRTNPVYLVGIEEPESALHPAAAAALMDSLREAAQHTQIVLTTHSPDLLDRFDEHSDSLLVVQSRQGETLIGPADEASVTSIREHLYSPGDLLRMDQLQPDERHVQRQLSLADTWNGDAT